MPGITTIFFNFINARKTYIWIGIFLILLALAIYYAFKYIYAPSAEKNKYKDVANMKKSGSGIDTVVIYLFYVNWCPHCKTAKPEWQMFAADYDGKIVNNKKISCVMIDCEDPKNASLVQDYDIQSYPTVKMNNEGSIIDFDSKITNSALEKFVNNMV